MTTNVQGLPAEAYRRHFQGAHPNPVGGAEAVMSHLISRALHLPAAHAPMVNVKAIPAEDGVDARGAGEFVSFSELACVLVGLHRAPQFTLRPRQRVVDTLSVHQVAAVVAPATALGAQPVLHAERLGIPVIAVRDNDTS